MFRDEIRQLKTGFSELRKFGVLVGLTVLGTVFWMRHRPHLLVMTPVGPIVRAFGKDLGLKSSWPSGCHVPKWSKAEERL